MKKTTITIQFRLTGLIPSKKNNQQIVKDKKTGRLYLIPSKRYLVWNRRAKKELTAQAHEIALKRGVTFPLQNVASLSVKMHFKDKIIRDLISKLESIQDTLTDALLIHDDDWMHINPITAKGVKIEGKNHITDIFLTITL